MGYVAGMERPSNTNQDVIKDAVTTTASFGQEYGASTGMLLPQDSDTFIQEPIADYPLYEQLRKDTVDRESGYIDLMGSTERNLRKKYENYNNISGSEVEPRFRSRGYKCVDATLGTEITKRFLRQNKAKENFQDLFLDRIGKTIKKDILDLAFNGDEGVKVVDGDTAFLSINDGYIKQFKNELPSKQIVDASKINDGFFSDEMFYELYDAVPEQFINEKYCWICSHKTRTKFIRYLKNRNGVVGDSAMLGSINASSATPLNHKFHSVPKMPEDIIIFTDPENLAVQVWQQIEFEMTSAGKELVSKQNIFYAWFMSMDFVLVEPRAGAMCINVGGYNGPMAMVVANMDYKAPKPIVPEPEIYPPLVTNVTPHEGQIGVPLDAKITISYNTPIKILDTSLITLQDITKKTPVNVSVSNTVDGNDLIIKPTDALTANHVYKVIAGIGAVARDDASGKATRRAEVSTFETTGNDNPPTQPDEFPLL